MVGPRPIPKQSRGETRMTGTAGRDGFSCCWPCSPGGYSPGPAGTSGSTGAIASPSRTSRTRSRTAGMAPRCAKLLALLDRRPDWDEALYLLGTCEVARGRTQPADEAWSQVAPDSRFAPRAVFGRMQLQMERGRFWEAEVIIRDALDDPRVDAASLPILLGPIYCHQGRLAETLRMIETRWNALNRAGEGASELAINLVRADIDLQQRSVPLEVTRSVLDQAASSAPDDDRIWLGMANLAIRTRSYDEAREWLDRCLKRRPEDVPVWRCRLDWAMATNRVAEARETLRHLPVEESSPAEIPRLVAWFAAAARGSRRGTAGSRTAHRRGSRQSCRVGPAGRARCPGRPVGPRRRAAKPEGCNRSAREPLCQALSTQPTEA